MKKKIMFCCLMIGASIFFMGAQGDEGAPILPRFTDQAKRECVAILFLSQKKLNNTYSPEQRSEIKRALERLMATIPIGEQKLRSQCSTLIELCDQFILPIIS